MWPKHPHARRPNVVPAIRIIDPSPAKDITTEKETSRCRHRRIPPADSPQPRWSSFSASTSPSASSSRQANGPGHSKNHPENSFGEPPYVSNTSRFVGQQQALQSFFGIGPQTCGKIMSRFYVHETAKISDLGNKQVLSLTAALSEMKIENDLRRQILDDIRRLKDTGTVRGRRHALGLPVRGQNTRSQIKTAIKLNKLDRRLGLKGPR
ncbi:hypothetical protein AJ79_02290 [Helicocarpus griseus UAMH5409]|uniref:30S ribosomal protein S13 n=1 Tax=Helicocarpus griseus UAMH5409 TaxID=1447875 RepID=A0A2B7Y2I8_9EURO|nr:hypothetical protein AJ79_02290 [Helicocarpus griseus UAMH5409]